MEIIKVYQRALNWGLKHHPKAHIQNHKSFGSAVAQLCCDDPEEPLNKREIYLVALLKVSGGPTCREGAAMWAAYGRGDALRSQHEGMSVFYTDQRFKRPGTWMFKEAVEYCEPYCYGDITPLHVQVFKTDPCFDDPPNDLKELRRLSKDTF